MAPYVFYDPFVKRTRSTLTDPNGPHYKKCPKCEQPWVGIKRHIKKHHTEPKPQRHRFDFFPKEKSAYCIMRRKGCSINAIANFFGRSTSVVHRALKRLRAYGDVRRFDMRKLPYIARMRGAAFRGAVMEKLRLAWELWVCGESDEPP